MCLTGIFCRRAGLLPGKRGAYLAWHPQRGHILRQLLRSIIHIFIQRQCTKRPHKAFCLCHLEMWNMWIINVNHHPPYPPPHPPPHMWPHCCCHPDWLLVQHFSPYFSHFSSLKTTIICVKLWMCCLRSLSSASRTFTFNFYMHTFAETLLVDLTCLWNWIGED